MSDQADSRARDLFQRAYQHQMQGELGDAIALYKASIELHPTAEAYTFLGWAYSAMDRFEEAIELCHKAIEVDPAFGNPYNDIGAYLIELEQYEEAISWLEKAAAAPRYDAPYFPHFNLGRVYEALGDYEQALACYDKALALNPLYLTARWAKQALLGQLN